MYFKKKNIHIIIKVFYVKMKYTIDSDGQTTGTDNFHLRNWVNIKICDFHERLERLFRDRTKVMKDIRVRQLTFPYLI